MSHISSTSFSITPQTPKRGAWVDKCMDYLNKCGAGEVKTVLAAHLAIAGHSTAYQGWDKLKEASNANRLGAEKGFYEIARESDRILKVTFHILTLRFIPQRVTGSISSDHGTLLRSQTSEENPQEKLSQRRLLPFSDAMDWTYSFHLVDWNWRSTSSKIFAPVEVGKVRGESEAFRIEMAASRFSADSKRSPPTEAQEQHLKLFWSSTISEHTEI